MFVLRLGLGMPGVRTNRRVNLWAINSNAFDYTVADGTQWARSDIGVTADQAASPTTGLTTADLVYENTANAGHAIGRQPLDIINGARYSVEFDLKAAGRPRVHFYEGAVTAARVLFDLSTGTVVDTAGGGSPVGSIVALGDDWHRCKMEVTVGASANIFVYLVRSGQTFFDSYVGDGASGVLFSNGGFYKA